jgi:hypothetical protein
MNQVYVLFAFFIHSLYAFSSFVLSLHHCCIRSNVDVVKRHAHEADQLQ